MSAFPLPDVEHPLTRGFWDAAARGELAIPRCADCGRWNWYPRERCVGFAVGRTIWWDALEGYVVGSVERSDAAGRIAAAYRRLIDAYAAA